MIESSTDIAAGSNGADVDQRRAVIFVRPSDDSNVALMSKHGLGSPASSIERGRKGSQAESEYVPLRELKGETWKSLDHTCLKSRGGGRGRKTRISSCSGAGPSSLPRPSSDWLILKGWKYIRRSSNVLFTSDIMALSSIWVEYRYQKEAGLNL